MMLFETRLYSKSFKVIKLQMVRFQLSDGYTVKYANLNTNVQLTNSWYNCPFPMTSDPQKICHLCILSYHTTLT